MLRTILVDDERPALDELTYLLNTYHNQDIEIIGQSDTAQGALSLISKEKPDLVFLDIQMRGLTGLELADMIHNVSPQTQIIFATAYDEYALKAFELDVTDYIVKPIEEERLSLAINHALTNQPPPSSDEPDSIKALKAFKSKKLPVDYQGRILLLNIKDIVYISSDTGNLEIHTRHHIYTSNKTLTELQDRLSEYDFYRIHRSYIVNLHEVIEVVPWFKGTYWLKVPDIDSKEQSITTSLPVSKSQVKIIREYLGL